MDAIAAGFWAPFRTAALMLGISLAAFVPLAPPGRADGRPVALVSARLRRRLPWLAAAGGGPAERGCAGPRRRARGGDAGPAWLLSLLGLIAFRAVAVGVTRGLVLLAIAMVALSWLLEPQQALALGSLFAIALALALWLVSLRRAAGGDRLAPLAALGMGLVVVSLVGLSWIALRRPVGWPVHAVSAVAAVGYLSMMAGALWRRYSYLLELSEVMAHGPAYDPVTRMRSHSETGQMIGELFFRSDAEPRPVGVIAVCIANLYALENLHGRAAFNHALFVTAGRLRRCVPETMEMGRLGEEGFLVLARSPYDLRRLEEIARVIRERLARPVVVSTSREPARLEAARTTWAAEVGIGVLATSTQLRPIQVVGTVRAMARTAWCYASRWRFDAAPARSPSCRLRRRTRSAPPAEARPWLAGGPARRAPPPIR